MTVEGVFSELSIERVTTDDNGHYLYPSAAGSRVAAEEWMDLARAGQIYVKDVDGSAVWRVGAIGSQGPHLDPINPDRISWSDPRSGAMEVWMHDFATGQRCRSPAAPQAVGRAADSRATGSFIMVRPRASP